MELGGENDEVNELTKMFFSALEGGHHAAMQAMISVKQKEIRCPLDISQCALMVAARGNTPVLKALLALFPRMSYSDSTGRRAIHYAAKNGHLFCVEALLKGGAISNCSDAEGFTPLHLACLNGHDDIVSFLVRQCAHINSCRTELGESAVHVAAKAGHVKVMEELVSYGADLNSTTRRNKGGETPLHKAVAADKPEMVEFLLSCGAVSSIADAHGKPPIHLACEKGFEACLAVMLARGASLEVKDSMGNTVLAVAVAANQTVMAKTLIDQGADVQHVGDNGLSLMHKASMRCNLDIIDYLANAGADVNVRSRVTLQSPLFTAVSLSRLQAVKKLIDLGADATLPDIKGHTPLHVTQSRIGGDSQEDIIMALLNAGGRLDVRGEDNLTPLQRCITHGVIRRNVSLPSLKLLCQAGSDLKPDEFTMGKKSPLFWLAYSGFLPEAYYLAKAGWDLNDEVWLVLPGKDPRQDRLHALLIDLFKTTPSLLASCRKTLLRHLCQIHQHTEVMSRVAMLPIPRPLQRFLLLSDCDTLDYSVLEADWD